MKLALVLGNSSDTIKQHLNGIVDNLTISVFSNTYDFLNTSIAMRSVYDRIIILSTLVDDNSLNDIYKFWNASVLNDTEVVLLCSKGVDEEKAKKFKQIFNTPVATAVLLSSTTVQSIIEVVTSPVEVLESKYGIKDVNTPVFDSIYDTDDKNDKNNKNEKNENNEKKEKKGIFGLKLRKNNKENVENKQETQKEQQVQQNIQNQQIQQNPQGYQNYQQNVPYQQMNQQYMQNNTTYTQGNQMQMQNQNPFRP